METVLLKQPDERSFLIEKVQHWLCHNCEMEVDEPETASPEMSFEKFSESSPNYINPEDLPSFEIIEENIYLYERKKTKRKKEVRRMRCECSVQPNGVACLEDECLNRLLMIECGSRCITGEACSNRRFEKKLYAKTMPFKTEKKGFGLKVLEDVRKGSFIIEYVGEVLDRAEFKRRVKYYAREREKHYYFMALKIDEIIDARFKANYARFINHSCDPNCETQKWTVNGELRVGFFAKRDIRANEELTFDYKLERYGRKAQKCHCESENCKGFIGVSDEITVDLETKKDSKNKRKKYTDKEKDEKVERKKDMLEDIMFEEEVEKLLNNGLRNKDDTLMLARLMVQAEDSYSREKLLDIILGTTEIACLRLFLDYHGLTLFWSWMVDLKDKTDFPLKKKILKALSILPVPNRTMLSDSKVLSVVEKWALCSTSVADEELESTKIKSCDTSDSETERNFSESLNNSERNGTHFSNYLVNITKALNSFEKSAENNGDTEESSCDNKTMDTNHRSDEESGCDNFEDKDENLDEKKFLLLSSEIANLAQNLLDSWKDLKETFRIPKREKKDEKEDHCKNSSESTASLNKNTEIKNTNSKQSTKGNYEDQSFEKIKVVCQRYKQFGPNFSKEKRTFYNKKSNSEDRRRKKENFSVLYKYDDASDHSYNDTSDHSYNDTSDHSYDNYEYSPPVYNSENNFYHSSHQTLYNNESQYEKSTCFSQSLPHNESQMFNKNCYVPPALPQNESQIYNKTTCVPQLLHHNNNHNQLYSNHAQIPRPALLPTPGTLPNMGRPSNLVCATPPSIPVTTGPPQVLSNALYPPPVRNQFLNHPTMTVPPHAAPTIAVPPVMPRITVPPPVTPTMAAPHAVTPTMAAPHSVAPTMTAPHQVAPTMAAPHQVAPTMAAPHQVAPTMTAPHQVAPTMTAPHQVAPTMTAPHQVASRMAAPHQVAPTMTAPHQVAPTMAAPHQVAPTMAAPHQVTPTMATSHQVAPLHPIMIRPNPPSVQPPPNFVNIRAIPSHVLPVQVSSSGLVTQTYQSAASIPTRVQDLPLPENWKGAKDSEGRTYYYNKELQLSQWSHPYFGIVNSPPTNDEPKERKRKSHRSDKKKKKKPASDASSTVDADTSSREIANGEIARKVKELFRAKISAYIIHCLNPYRKDDCQSARITSNEDFKHLARKLTHFIISKELKHCKNMEDLDANDSVKLKTRDFIRKYMEKYGPVYTKD